VCFNASIIFIFDICLLGNQAAIELIISIVKKTIIADTPSKRRTSGYDIVRPGGGGRGILR